MAQTQTARYVCASFQAGNLESELLKVKQHLAQLSIEQHFGTASCDNLQSSGYCSNMTNDGCSGQRHHEGPPVVGTWGVIQEGEETLMSTDPSHSTTAMCEVVRELESNLRFLQKCTYISCSKISVDILVYFSVSVLVVARYQLLTEDGVSTNFQDSVPQTVVTLTVVKAIEGGMVYSVDI